MQILTRLRRLRCSPTVGFGFCFVIKKVSREHRIKLRDTECLAGLIEKTKRHLLIRNKLNCRSDCLPVRTKLKLETGIGNAVYFILRTGVVIK